MSMFATVIDTSALANVIIAAFVTTVGVTAAFSLTILGAARSTEMRRNGRSLEASAFGVLSLVALAGSLAAVAFGIIVMTSK
jgi:hypothetical protein